MVSIDDLIGMDGVVFAAKYTMDGKCREYRSQPQAPGEMADSAAEHISTVTKLFNTLAGSFSRESEMKWVPQYGWTYTGGDWTVIVGGDTVAFVDTARADINRIYDLLIKAGAEGKVGQSV